MVLLHSSVLFWNCWIQKWGSCAKRETSSWDAVPARVVIWNSWWKPKIFCLTAVEFATCIHHAKLLCCLYVNPSSFFVSLFYFLRVVQSVMLGFQFPTGQAVLAPWLCRTTTEKLHGVHWWVWLSNASPFHTGSKAQDSLLLFQQDQCSINRKSICHLQSFVHQKCQNSLLHTKQVVWVRFHGRGVRTIRVPSW